MITNKGTKKYRTIIATLSTAVLFFFTNIAYAKLEMYSINYATKKVSGFMKIIEHYREVNNGEFQLTFALDKDAGKPSQGTSFIITDEEGTEHIGELTANELYNTIGEHYFSCNVQAKFKKRSERSSKFRKFSVKPVDEDGRSLPISNEQVLEGNLLEMEFKLKKSSASNQYDILEIKNTLTEKNIQIIEIENGSKGHINTGNVTGDIAPNDTLDVNLSLSSQAKHSNNPASMDEIEITYEVDGKRYYSEVRISLYKKCKDKVCKKCPTCPINHSSSSDLAVVSNYSGEEGKRREKNPRDIKFTVINKTDDKVKLTISEPTVENLYRVNVHKSENCGTSLESGETCYVNYLAYANAGEKVEQSISISRQHKNDYTQDIDIKFKKDDKYILDVTPASESIITEVNENELEDLTLNYSLKNMSEEKTIKIKEAYIESSVNTKGNNSFEVTIAKDNKTLKAGSDSEEVISVKINQEKIDDLKKTLQKHGEIYEILIIEYEFSKDTTPWGQYLRSFVGQETKEILEAKVPVIIKLNDE